MSCRNHDRETFRAESWRSVVEALEAEAYLEEGVYSALGEHSHQLRNAAQIIRDKYNIVETPNSPRSSDLPK